MTPVSFRWTILLRNCVVTPVQSLRSQIRPQPSGLGLRHTVKGYVGIRAGQRCRLALRHRCPHCNFAGFFTVHFTSQY
jgi:hypothetical protein